MANPHKEKYISKLLIGIGLTTAGVFVILYASFERGQKEDWYFWGIIASLAINAGIILLGSAFVHKIKSDLIRRQKQREQQKTFTSD
jgi:uncharacterized membrane protein HdeD (DUF308 family)